LILVPIYLSLEILNVSLGLDTFEVIAYFILVGQVLSCRCIVLGAELVVLLSTGVGVVLTCVKEFMAVQDDLVDLLDD
jgi:hypothetical protein